MSNNTEWWVDTDTDIATEEALGMLREVEVAWLAEKLGLTIANLAHPVGCGIQPSQEWLERCAGVLFDRYLDMIRWLMKRPPQDQPQTPAPDPAKTPLPIQRIETMTTEAPTYTAETPPLTEFDLKMIRQSQRMNCLKAATRMGDGTGGTASQVIHDAQVFFDWIVAA